MSSSSQKATQLLADLSITEEEYDETKKPLSEQYVAENEDLKKKFFEWSEHEQLDFLGKLVLQLTHYQLGRLDDCIRPMLQRDFIANLPPQCAETILFNVDASSLKSCEDVSVNWRFTLARGQHWKKLIEKNVRTISLWKGLSEKRQWDKFLHISRDAAAKRICEKFGYDYETMRGSYETFMLLHVFYRKLYPKVLNDITTIDVNWKRGNYKMTRINCRSENSKGVYCLQYDDDKIVSGLRDNTIKIWDRKDYSCSRVLSGHTGSVLCLQYDNRVIISGSSDATVRVWDVETGECLKTLIHHCEAVLHLRFSDGIMVTCSKDRSIAVWDMASPRDINIRRVLVGHRAAVNVVDFDDRYIVSASGDRTIKVWSMDSLEFVRTLAGHRRGIACLQYRGRLVVSGSSDNTIRLWDIHSGVCLRVLEGHEELVRCIRFDEKRIVSGAYDGKIKVWDLQAALDPRAMPSDICMCTLVQHTGRVFRLQFDDFQIVSSSHDDTILIWDFLDAPVDGTPPPPIQFYFQQPPHPNENGPARAAIMEIAAAINRQGGDHVDNVNVLDIDVQNVAVREMARLRALMVNGNAAGAGGAGGAQELEVDALSSDDEGREPRDDVAPPPAGRRRRRAGDVPQPVVANLARREGRRARRIARAIARLDVEVEEEEEEPIAEDEAVVEGAADGPAEGPPQVGQRIDMHQLRVARQVYNRIIRQENEMQRMQNQPQMRENAAIVAQQVLGNGDGAALVLVDDELAEDDEEQRPVVQRRDLE